MWSESTHAIKINSSNNNEQTINNNSIVSIATITTRLLGRPRHLRFYFVRFLFNIFFDCVNTIGAENNFKIHDSEYIET